jgi:hypothetical protein
MIGDDSARNGWANGMLVHRHDLAEDLAVFRIKPCAELLSCS